MEQSCLNTTFDMKVSSQMKEYKLNIWIRLAAGRDFQVTELAEERYHYVIYLQNLIMFRRTGYICSINIFLHHACLIYSQDWLARCQGNVTNVISGDGARIVVSQ